MPSTNNAVADWPKSKLHNPWDDECDCYIEYDDEKKLLIVVDAEETKDVIHSFNPLDIIGVDVEVKLFETTSTSVLPGVDLFCNIIPTEGRTSPVDGDSNDEDGNANIFNAVTKNKDSIFNITDNDLLAKNSQAAAILNIYTYPKTVQTPGYLWGTYKKSATLLSAKYVEGTGHRVPHHYSFPVAASHDFEAVSALVKSIRQVAQLAVSQQRPKCLVLINPKSGTGQAPSMWEATVKPMLQDEAGMDCTMVVETEYANHAKEYMEQCKDLLDYSVVLCLGGDGIMHEVLQGWRMRNDYEQVLKKITLGILGCGTSNGLAKSLTFEAEEEYGTVESTFLIARGKKHAMDLSTYETSLGTVHTSFLTFTWAMIADIDINSEILRCLGAFRMDIWGALCVASLTHYKGRLSYLPADHKNKDITLPPLKDPLPSDWKVIEDDILLLWASHLSHAGMAQHSSPPSTLEDGVFQIMLVRGKHVGRIAMASILLSLDSGKHVDHPNVEFVECVAYRLEPLSKGSHNDLDGELVESGPIQAKILPAAVRIFANSIKTKKEEK